MAKKHIYLAQPTYMSASTVHFPYAIGSLASYAWKHEEIAETYTLNGVFFLRDPIDGIVASLDAPFLMGFSCYIWNIEYNKALAKKVKERFPACVIVFGGPQIPGDASLLEECPFIDVLIHNEGEVSFYALLKAFSSGTSLYEVPNLSFRDSGETVTTSFDAICSVDGLPSPFASGFYERLMREHPDVVFVPLVETNRGCPNHCAYCSWSTGNTRVRLFPLERVFGDLQWVSDHKMEFIGFADANFGMFPRDEQIADKLIELHERTGYPKKFQVSYSKDSGDRVFRITEKLSRAGLCKGVTLSFQTMSETAQKNIGRSNMDIDYYNQLLQKYAEVQIPTYTELIVGLPGETYDSFRSGVEELLENGQHTSLLVHLCELLPLAAMDQQAYLRKYSVGYTRIPLNQPHAQITDADDIREYSRIVTSTYSMPQEDWKRTVLFATCVSCFHHLGLLQMFALYLYFEKGVRYTDFYSSLLEWLLRDEGKVFPDIRARLDEIVERQASAVFFDPRFGDVAWGFEEYAFLRIVLGKDAFYADVLSFLERYFDDASLCRELLAYQSFIVKTIDPPKDTFHGRYRWKPYFDSLLRNRRADLERADVSYRIEDGQVCASWPEYARVVLWYGRRGGKYIYSSELKEIRQDG